MNVVDKKLSWANINRQIQMVGMTLTFFSLAKGMKFDKICDSYLERCNNVDK